MKQKKENPITEVPQESSCEAYIEGVLTCGDLRHVQDDDGLERSLRLSDPDLSSPCRASVLRDDVQRVRVLALQFYWHRNGSACGCGPLCSSRTLSDGA